MDSEALKHRMGKRFRVPSLPSVVARVREAVANPQGSLAEIGRLIALDPPLSGKVLRTANGAAYGLKTKVVDIEHAASVLGLRTLGELLADVPLIGAAPPPPLGASAAADRLAARLAGLAGATAPPKTPEPASPSSAAAAAGAAATGAAAAGAPPAATPRLDVTDFWRHAVLTARVAQALPEAVREGYSREDLYLAGLMHDVGHLAFLDRLGEDFLELVRRSRRDGTPLNQLERETFGFAHTEVGALIAHSWNLPDFVVRATRSHHDLTGFALTDRATGLVAFANLVAEAAFRGGLRRLQRRLPPALADSLELSTDLVERVFAVARRLADEVELE